MRTRRGIFEGSQVQYRARELVLGEFYCFSWWGSHTSRRCKFIKVTRKGFNFLDVETNQCILKTHIYGVDMAGKEYPRDLTNVKVWISDRHTILRAS